MAKSHRISKKNHDNVYDDQESKRKPGKKNRQKKKMLIDQIFDKIRLPVFKSIKRCFDYLSPVLCALFWFLMFMQVYAGLVHITPILKQYTGTMLGLTWGCIGLVIFYNVMFNHLLAMLIKPGSPTDLVRIEKIRLEQKNRLTKSSLSLQQMEDDDRFTGISIELKKLLRYRNKSVEQLRDLWQKKCKRCDEIKPARTHHCAVCDACVFAMDHHCPWVNNCLGQDNIRFFLLFIFYLFIGAIYSAVTIMTIWNNAIYKQNHETFTFILILDLALSFIMIGFNGWNWFLAVQGKTTIEYWGGQVVEDGCQEFTFGFKSVWDNLYTIFGTQKGLRIFSPSLRTLPMSGLEWSFLMIDNGYDCEGYKVAEDDLEMVLSSSKKSKKKQPKQQSSIELQSNPQLISDDSKLLNDIPSSANRSQIDAALPI